MNQCVFVSATPGEWELDQSGGKFESETEAGKKGYIQGTGHVVEQIIRPTGVLDPEIFVRPTTGQVDDLLHEIQERLPLQERVLVTTLTKRMAEDLTEYFQERGVRVRYLHSEINSIERIEILQDLRNGEFDVLIGVNLLREGLDITRSLSRRHFGMQTRKAFCGQSDRSSRRSDVLHAMSKGKPFSTATT